MNQTEASGNEDFDDDHEHDGFADEYSLPPSSMCTHHDDRPAVTYLSGEPLCEDCLEQHEDSFRD